MNDSIPLHKEHGLNPKLTFCPRCGDEGNEIMLIGARDDKFTCRACTTVSFGARKCLKCADGGAGTTEKIGASERLPGSLCTACKTEVAEHKREVAAGGVYFRCADCNAQGVIKAGTQFAVRVREFHATPAPAPIGVEFSNADCPQCSVKPV